LPHTLFLAAAIFCAKEVGVQPKNIALVIHLPVRGQQQGTPLNLKNSFWLIVLLVILKYHPKDELKEPRSSIIFLIFLLMQSYA